jgi:hypothetical protein
MAAGGLDAALASRADRSRPELVVVVSLVAAPMATSG